MISLLFFQLLPHGFARLFRRPPERRGSQADAGMSTAEYAVGTLAAVAFAAVLYAVVSSSTTRSMVSSVVERALTTVF